MRQKRRNDETKKISRKMNEISRIEM